MKALLLLAYYSLGYLLMTTEGSPLLAVGFVLAFLAATVLYLLLTRRDS